MQNNHPGTAPNYTDAFLTTLGGIIFMGLLVISSLAGMITAFIIAALLDRLFQHLGR